ncbi:methyl-accepting chemotaxis protein [Gracilinema caldarium]|uniref:methyl-accepting chemotaxis protein n=1 Tax=Gracilinema caldarium TaxID=215591 RepID=UPI0026EE1483|nr:methyl-accepting chemotaxis protein [Gracilinema caldarium]
MLFKRVLSLLLMVFLSLSAFGQSNGRNQYALSQWQTQVGDVIDGSSVNFDPSLWSPCSIPGDVKLQGGYAWLYTEFELNAVPFKMPYYIVLGRLDAAYKVYLNGSLVASRGTFPSETERFSLPGNHSAYFLLPSGLLKTSGKNVLALRLYSPASSVALYTADITDKTTVLFEENVVTFLNATLYTILAALCAFIGIYFFALWLVRKKDTPHLWYALAALAIALYFTEIGASSTMLPYGINRAIAKAGLSISMAALVKFFIAFCELRMPRWFSWLLFIVPLGITTTFLSVSNDLIAIGKVFNTALLFIQFCIVFIAVVTIRSVAKGKKEALPLLFGVILGVGLGTHDVIYSVLGKKPLVWLQGIGFFCLNLSLFISLTFRSSRLYKDLETYAAAVRQKTEQLGKFIGQLEETALTISSITTAIDNDAGQAARSAEKMASGAEQIRHGAEAQIRAVQDSRQAIQHFTASLERVNSGVQHQAEGIRQSADSVSVVADAVADVATHMEQTARSAEALKQSAEQGLIASQEMTETIDKIKSLSGTIVDIVKAVEDFAERTNLLAMNAAIEAAHSGAAGRGFAVIANEIKNLASASAERAGKIRDSIREITSRIESSVEANGRMTHALAEVSSSSRLTLDSIVSIRNALQAQQGASEQLRKNLSDLSDTAHSIREEAGKQQKEGHTVELKIDELLAISERLNKEIDAIVRENASIVQMVQQLAVVSGQGKQAVVSMNALLESRTA